MFHSIDFGLLQKLLFSCFKETSFSFLLLFFIYSAIMAWVAMPQEFILPASYTITLQAVWWAQVNLTFSIFWASDWSQMGLDIFEHYCCFSKLRSSVNQIPLTYWEFGCPVPIMALETPPNICAMVSAHLGTFSLSSWVDGHRQKHHCNWQQFIDSQGENLACSLASLVQTEIFSKTDQAKQSLLILVSSE